LAPETTGEPRIRAIVGLGNPGPQYERTRHNAGFLVLERLLRDAGGAWILQGNGSRADAWLGRGPERLLLSRPLTFMNRSGAAVLDLLSEHAWTPQELLVVLDDAALPEGRLRLRPRGGAGGHRGLESILEHLGTEEVPRLRFGVGLPPDGGDLAEFVLAPLEGADWERMSLVVERAAEAVLLVCRDGLQKGMNHTNPGPEPLGGPGD
jgi:peptidyl-tRNA hydrolase, PTH1 family